ncbi:MAG TPA: hypothetical protein VFV38_24315 [Ktedonobacteraceae bacterium]|nr:hypothetical protein [Ktedonobacteraceae bacterium]
MRNTDASNKVENEKAEKVAPYDILYITGAYNRREISIDEWLRLSREWAENVIKQHGDSEGKA